MNHNPLICCIFNYAPLYREAIYTKMEKELNCVFYFGDIEKSRIKSLDFKVFKKKPVQFRTLTFYGFNWIHGSVPLTFSQYQKYILTGEPYCLSAWVILLLNRLQRKQTFLWTHGWYGDETFLKRNIKKLFFNLADGCYLYGKHAKDLMLQNGFNDKKLHVIFNSLNYKQQLCVRKKLINKNTYINHFSNSYPILIFTGRLTAVKKLDLLITAHSILQREGIHLNVIILGDGPEKSALVALVEKYDLTKNYWFYGACYEEEKIGELIYNATVSVSPGNIGLTAIHSLMYGTPAITHNNFSNQMPEYEAIKEGQTGDFFSENDPQSLSKTIATWLKAEKSRQDIRKNCFDIVDRFYHPNYQHEVLKRTIMD